MKSETEAPKTTEPKTEAEVTAAPAQKDDREKTTKTPQTQDENIGKYNYVLNTNTMKFHYPDCSSVDKIQPYNREDYFGTREDVIARGFDPCKRCDP